MKGISGGPRFSTDVIVGRNGQEVRNANWQDALWQFNAKGAIRTRADADALYAFFVNCKGKETPFLLQAGMDYTIGTAAAPVQINANSSAGTYQLIKPYTDTGGNTYNRTIIRPSATTSDLAVYAGGSLLTYSSNYTYSSTTGVITVTSGGGGGTPLKVYCAKFYTVVRFDTDFLDIEMIHWVVSSSDYSLHQMPDIPLVEVRDVT